MWLGGCLGKLHHPFQGMKHPKAVTCPRSRSFTRRSGSETGPHDSHTWDSLCHLCLSRKSTSSNKHKPSAYFSSLFLTLERTINNLEHHLLAL